MCRQEAHVDLSHPPHWEPNPPPEGLKTDEAENRTYCSNCGPMPCLHGSLEEAFNSLMRMQSWVFEPVWKSSSELVMLREGGSVPAKLGPTIHTAPHKVGGLVFCGSQLSSCARPVYFSSSPQLTTARLEPLKAAPEVLIAWCDLLTWCDC